MPNVAGVQFPYTPQGQQAAQLYQGSLSPRQGLGFRPIGMENGGSPEDRAMLESASRVVKELYALDSAQEVQNYINNSRSDLEYIARLDNPMFDMLRGLLKRYPPQSNFQDAPQSNLQGPPSLSTYPGEPPREEEGLGSVADSPGYYPELNGYFPPEREWGPPGGVPGMAHGGVPRGTVAGELEPRGYLTARQAGETMRERAKGLSDRRNYGGGIGSLYNRYG